MGNSPDQAPTTPLDFGITCIDAGYVRPGIACFYLLEQDAEYAIIETGTSHSVAHLQQLMAARSIDPARVRYVIPTHVHLDHAGGAGAMMAMLPNAELLLHPRGVRHMVDPQRLIDSALQVYGKERFQRLYGEVRPVAAERVVEMGDGESIRLAGRRLEFRHTRGHAEHHFCIWDEVSRGWFSGDMFGISYPWFRFPGGDFVLPATTPTQFDPQAYLASLELLGSYGPERMYLTHYGELRYTREQGQLLASQLDAYCKLAPGHAGDSPAMEKALTDYSLTRVREFGHDLPEHTLRKLLAMDMGLNAQGLEVWLRRS